jgi:hypothetical protein
MVIENGVDSAHFRPVHQVRADPDLVPISSEQGEFAVHGRFTLPVSPWQRATDEHGLVVVPYVARAYGGAIMLSHLGGAYPYWVLTCATPTTQGDTLIRLAIAVSAGAGGAAPDPELCEYLLRQARSGVENDVVIWNRLSLDSPSHYTDEDHCVVEFRRYLRRIAQEQP